MEQCVTEAASGLSGSWAARIRRHFLCEAASFQPDTRIAFTHRELAHREGLFEIKAGYRKDSRKVSGSDRSQTRATRQKSGGGIISACVGGCKA